LSTLRLGFKSPRHATYDATLAELRADHISQAATTTPYTSDSETWIWNLSACLLAQLKVRGFWHRVGLWVEHGTPGVSNIEVGLVINNNIETLKTLIWSWCHSLNFKNVCSRRDFLYSFIQRTVFFPLSMIFLCATYAVLDEHVSPPYAQPVSVLQWKGLTFLSKDALYRIAVQEDIECEEVDHAGYRQWTATRYHTSFTKSTVILKNKNQLYATYYFIVLLIGSKCFGHYYAHHQELATIMLITTLVVSFLVCCRWPIIISGRDTCPVCASDHKRIAPPVNGSFLHGHSGWCVRLTAHKYHFPSQQCVELYLYSNYMSWYVHSDCFTISFLLIFPFLYLVTVLYSVLLNLSLWRCF